MRRSEDNLYESILSYLHVGPGIQAQVIGLGDPGLFSQSHLTVTFYLGWWQWVEVTV